MTEQYSPRPHAAAYIHASEVATCDACGRHTTDMVTLTVGIMTATLCHFCASWASHALNTALLNIHNYYERTAK